jgi:iron complex transport system substrate-binding protein
MKTKRFVGIAIVLGLLFFVAMPAIAAEEDDFVLGVYGNANEDDTIDMRDVTYTKLIIFGKKPETELANAYYDDEVDVLDVVQTKLIILGRESELTVIDACTGRIVTVSMPVERMIIVNEGRGGTTVKSLGAEDKVVGVDYYIHERKIFFPELSELPMVGIQSAELDVELIVALEPDIVLLMNSGNPYEVAEVLGALGIPAVCLLISDQDYYTIEVRKLGYILDKRNEAEELIDFIEGYVGTIAERVEGLSEDEKPRVYYEAWDEYLTFGKESGERGMLVTMAGGINIAGDLPGAHPAVEPEWVIDRNPSIILRSAYTGFPIGLLSGYEYDDPSSMKAFREDIMGRPGFETIDAVKKENVYLITAEISQDFYPIGLTYMAMLFHPDLFEDLDPEALHQVFLTRFQHLDYDLDEHGVFVYPPIEVGGGLAGIPERYKEQI